MTYDPPNFPSERAELLSQLLSIMMTDAKEPFERVAEAFGEGWERIVAPDGTIVATTSDLLEAAGNYCEMMGWFTPEGVAETRRRLPAGFVGETQLQALIAELTSMLPIEE